VSTEDGHEEQGCDRGDTTDNNIEADMMQDDALGCHVADEDSRRARERRHLYSAKWISTLAKARPKVSRS